MIKLEISFRAMILLILTPLMFWAVIELWPVILLVLVAVIFMLGLLPFVEALVRKGVSRGWAVLLIFAVILAALLLLFGIMVPPLIDEVTAVKDNLPESAREIEELLATFGITVELQERARNIDWDSLISGRAAVDYGQRVLTVTISLITIFVMTAYLLADTPRLSRFISQFIPEGQKEDADRLFQGMTRVVGGYLRGQLITSLAIGVFTFLTLRIIGVPNPLAFAVLAAFADIVPLVGALIAVVPPVAAALQDSSTKAIIVLGVLLAYQQFEDRIMIPRVYGQVLNLPPLIVLVAVLAGAELLGIVGVLLALPLTAAARVAVDYTIENRRLPLISAGSEQSMAPDMPPDPERGPQPRRRRFPSFRRGKQETPEN